MSTQTNNALSPMEAKEVQKNHEIEDTIHQVSKKKELPMIKTRTTVSIREINRVHLAEFERSLVFRSPCS